MRNSASMEFELKKLLWPLVVLLLNVAVADPEVPCVFIFGDFESPITDYLHYHDIFPSEITSIYIPPYATASGEEILRGVNYSYPVARSRSKNGHYLGDRISLDEQVKNHQNIVLQIVSLFGNEDTAADYLKECVYLVGIGSNNYLNSYHMPEQFANALVGQYYEQFKVMYKYGARKVGVMGCSPKSACHMFNDNLKSLVNELNNNLLEAKFTFADILNHPDPYVSILENHAIEEPQVPCYFIFGDSLVDNGNNNLLFRNTQANYPPYGIDFPYGSTGRFTNGRTVVDLLAELLGFSNYMPPYTFAKDEDLLRGVNYASAAAGILDESGGTLGSHFSFNQQLQHHQSIVLRISTMLGSNETAQEYLNKCLYSVGMGGNDYSSNYFSDDYNTSSLYTPEEYVEVLATQYTQQLMILYDHGARKIAVIGLEKIGCTPLLIAKYGLNDSSCVAYINDAATLFDIRLLSLVDEFNTNLTDAQFIFVNSSGILTGDLSAVGITVLDVACCTFGTGGLCVALETPCQNRSAYAYWDNDHPTEASNLVSAIKAYNSSDRSITYPMDIRTLASL